MGGFININFDTIISFAILVIFILVIWAKVQQQTLKELITELMEIVKERGEDTVEHYY